MGEISFTNYNQIAIPEKESAEIALFRAEANRKIENLLRANADLERVAILLGAEKYLKVIPRKGTSSIYQFDVKSFIDDQIKQKSFLKLPEEFLKTDEVILPPDPGEIRTGSGEGIDQKDVIFRSQFLAELLSEMGLEYSVKEGENVPNMMRKLSYYTFIISKINKLVFVNNEEGNSTFIIHQFSGGLEEAEEYCRMSKDALKKLPKDIFSELVYPGNKEDWKMEMQNILENGPDHVLSFEDVCQKVRIIGFKGAKDYALRYKNFSNLPSNPDHCYRDKGWKSWGDFLGTGKEIQKSEQILLFDEARQKARDFGFKNERDYRSRYKNIPGLPGDPRVFYKKKGWSSWADFLGIELELRQKTEQILPFKEAKEKATSLGFKDGSDYFSRYKDFPGLPGNPDQHYRDKGWKSWGDFLGTGKEIQKSEQILPFEEARQKARSFGFKGVVDYSLRYKNIPGLPSLPRDFYKNKGWKDWIDFLGIERIRQKSEQLLSFEEARQKVRNFDFKGVGDYQSNYKNISGLPCNPDQHYKNKGWKDWHDFLGIGRETQKPEQILPFKEARQKARNFGFKSKRDYLLRYKNVPGLPGNPGSFYSKDDWKGWDDFLRND